METIASFTQETSNYDEVSMQQSMIFSDSLKDLKNLRTQLYSAAEYFEYSYKNDDQKQIVVETLKDYAIKALVNTVDHLGSVTYKVNDLLDEKVDEVTETELCVSCIEQRLWTCQDYINHEGLSQQSLVINTPKYFKKYILPVGETMNGAIHMKSKYQSCNLDDKDDWHQCKNAVRSTIIEPSPPLVGKVHSPSPFLQQYSQRAEKFSFSKSIPKKEPEKRTVSPHRFPLLRSGSVVVRSSTPNPTRMTTPKSSVERPRWPSEPRKSASMHVRSVGDNPKETEQFPSKSKRLLKSLLSRRKFKKDDMLYTYLDEY